MWIFCISGCLAVPVNPDKWCSTVFGERPLLVSFCPPQITPGLTRGIETRPTRWETGD